MATITKTVVLVLRTHYSNAICTVCTYLDVVVGIRTSNVCGRIKKDRFHGTWIV